MRKTFFGKLLTGKDSLSVSVERDYNSIKGFLDICYKKYLSDDYKKHFEWIDYITELKNPTLLEKLNKNLTDRLKNDNDIPNDKIWMAVPEMIEWENIQGFKYKKNLLKDDINIKDFLNTITRSDKEKMSVDFLKSRKIQVISAENDQVVLHKWSAYKCIYCELERDNKLFLLNDGKWYEVQQDFVKRVDEDFKNLRNKNFGKKLSKYNKHHHNNETEYNKEICKNNKNFCLMDNKIIRHGGGHGKIEFCDIFTKDNEIIHIKRYGNSSVLSHLFSQGYVSAELFLEDEDFRKKVSKKLPAGFKIDVDNKPKTAEYKIIFGIISSSSNELEIPFFSKVNLRNAKKRLENFRYQVYLFKIDTF